MRVLTAKWETLSRISPVVVTGEEADTEPVLAAKPFFIYVTDGSTEGDSDKIEKVILDDNKILVGMRVFTCVKMTPEQVAADPALENKSRDTRYFIIVSRDLKEVSVVDGSKLKTSALFKTMKKFASNDYRGNYEKAVKDILKLLNDYDKVNDAKQLLETKRQKEGLSDGEIAKIEKELADLAEEQKQLEAREQELLKFELKA